MALRLRRQEDEQRGLIAFATDVALKPVRPFVSRPARRVYLTTFLLGFAAFVLLGFATTAYTLFYWSYLPRIGFERTIHLQFDHVYSAHPDSGVSAHPYPYGTATLASDLVSAQDYDVAVELVLPRTPQNRAAGNFMLEVSMFAPSQRASTAATSGNVMDTVRADVSPTSTTTDLSAVLARSRRPATLPYRSPLIDLLHTLTSAPSYLLNLRTETTTLHVPILEGIAFAKGWRNIPTTLKLEIQSSHQLQIYSAKATFHARFRGLRWWMYNHRVLSAVGFIGSFWVTEMVFAGLAWGVLTLYMAKPAGQVKAEAVHEVAERVKRDVGEEEEGDVKLSDTERTFPTLSGQPALRYLSPNEVKREEEEEDAGAVALVPESVARAAEADDEDEDEDMDFFDSGIGTSMESSGPGRKDSMRRRRGRLPGREGDGDFK